MKFIYLITYVSIFSALSGCGGGGSDNSNNNASTQTVLEGSWQSICYQATTDYEINKQTFTNEIIEATVNVYDDSACQNNIITTTMKGVFSVGGSKTLGTGETVTDLDITLQSATIILRSSTVVDFFNNDIYFNCNNTKSYVLNQETDVSGCAFITDQTNIGSPEYAIFFIDIDKLYSSDFADTAALRPTAIDYSPNNIGTKL